MPDTPVEATAADLARRAKKEANDPDVVAAFHAAVELVDEAVVDAWRPVPSYVRRECVLSAGYAILDRTKSSHGVGQLTTVEGGGGG
ncbi:hypothetical protein, partial [Aeromicrobium sp. WCS2018Hpa-33]|uniref:hypothetical protein n=1 Tax=Aeromicrobium sp. WCS2018Hpa-33 TaxID=3073629 RepID=UPI002883399A